MLDTFAVIRTFVYFSVVIVLYLLAHVFGPISMDIMHVNLLKRIHRVRVCMWIPLRVRLWGFTSVLDVFMRAPYMYMRTFSCSLANVCHYICFVGVLYACIIHGIQFQRATRVCEWFSAWPTQLEIEDGASRIYVCERDRERPLRPRNRLRLSPRD